MLGLMLSWQVTESGYETQLTDSPGMILVSGKSSLIIGHWVLVRPDLTLQRIPRMQPAQSNHYFEYYYRYLSTNVTLLMICLRDSAILAALLSWGHLPLPVLWLDARVFTWSWSMIIIILIVSFMMIYLRASSSAAARCSSVFLIFFFEWGSRALVII